MTRLSRVRLLSLVIGVTAVFGGAGCGFVTGLFNDDFLGGLGFDPATIRPGQGTIVVSFTNNSPVEAVFQAFHAADAGNLATAGTRNFSVTVAAGETRAEVIECPIELFAPGSVDGAGAVQAVGCFLLNGDQVIDIPYNGVPLSLGGDFQCGDLMQVTLLTNAAGEFVAVNVLVRRGQ